MNERYEDKAAGMEDNANDKVKDTTEENEKVNVTNAEAKGGGE